MNQFSLVQAVDRFSQRVVIAVAPAADRRFDARFGQPFAVANADVYTPIAFGRRCPEAGMQPSMGTAGDAYDNAMCESFFGTLEAELLSREHFATREQARQRIFWFLEGWYNVRRLHSSVGDRSPLKFENINVKRQTVSLCGLPTGGQRHVREKRPAARPWTTSDSTLNGGQIASDRWPQIRPLNRVNLIAPHDLRSGEVVGGRVHKSLRGGGRRCCGRCGMPKSKSRK
ncbi:hypothetical protein FHX57_007576 [Paraburkholderia tropica]|nr:hypothetical protein [Paraburkholderia tropica]MBB3005188.1 hypothetical protein [Paraburkholderia tropica]MBB6324142.1 hypothetical protein [Paraburkholderia tropica]